MTKHEQRPTPLASWPATLRDALLLAIVGSGLALAANALRSTGAIALVADRPYEVLVPCPEHESKAPGLSAAEVDLRARGLLLVDAREKKAFSAWHLPGARSVPFDYLAPTEPKTVRELVRSGARQIVVYGDGADPDCGEQLAHELASKGLRRVFFVRGGAPALRRARGGR